MGRETGKYRMGIGDTLGPFGVDFVPRGTPGSPWFLWAHGLWGFPSGVWGPDAGPGGQGSGPSVGALGVVIISHTAHYDIGLLIVGQE